MCKTNSVFLAFKYNPTVAEGRGEGGRRARQITSQAQNTETCSTTNFAYQMK